MDPDYTVDAYRVAIQLIGSASEASRRTLAIFLWARLIAFESKDVDADVDFKIDYINRAVDAIFLQDEASLEAVGSECESRALVETKSVSLDVAFWSTGRYACSYFITFEQRVLGFIVDVFLGLLESEFESDDPVFVGEVGNIVSCLSGRNWFSQPRISDKRDMSILIARAARERIGSYFSSG